MREAGDVRALRTVGSRAVIRRIVRRENRILNVELGAGKLKNSLFKKFTKKTYPRKNYDLNSTGKCPNFGQAVRTLGLPPYILLYFCKHINIELIKN